MSDLLPKNTDNGLGMPMDPIMDIAYFVEYAKSDRSKCRGCNSPITVSELRLAIMDYKPQFNCKIPKWHHMDCFFFFNDKCALPKDISDIHNINTLSKNDQAEIASRIEKTQSTTSELTALEIEAMINLKRARTNNEFQDNNRCYFKIEYAKQIAKCEGCPYNVATHQLRIATSVPTTARGLIRQQLYGDKYFWFHVYCFAGMRKKLGFFEDASKLEGFNLLNQSAQNYISKILPEIVYEEAEDDGEPPAKRIKLGLEDLQQNRPRSLPSTPFNECSQDLSRFVSNPNLLRDMKFVILSPPTRGKRVLAKEITNMGGQVAQKVHKGVTAVFARKADVDIWRALNAVHELGINVIDEEFVDVASKCQRTDQVPSLVHRMTISKWANQEKVPIPVNRPQGPVAPVMRPVLLDPVTAIRNGATVYVNDLLKIATIYNEGPAVYEVVLCKTKPSFEDNYFLKLQIWKSKTENVYWVVHCWGTGVNDVCTNMVVKKIRQFTCIREAIALFERVYEMKTCTLWGDRCDPDFKPVPGYYFPIAFALASDN